jgi:hypothetical protein
MCSGKAFSMAGTLLSTSFDASDGNIVYARDAGGWASAVTVDQIYGHADVHDPGFALALNRVWQEA